MPHIPFAPDDIFLYHQVTHLQATTAHDDVVCAVRFIDRGSDSYLSALWVLDATGERPPLQLTAGIALDHQPQWSPDGKRIAFLSDRSGGAPQLHLIERAGGEARQVGSFPNGLVEIAWHPDGQRLFVVALVDVDPDVHDDDADRSPPERGPDAPEIVWRLPYKLDGAGYTLAQRMHLHCVTLADGKVTQLTRGDFDLRGFAFSPDGEQVAIVRTRSEAQHCSDIWVMPAGGGEPRRLSVDQAIASSPSWSPDGRTIVFTGALDEGDAQSRLWRIDLGRPQAEVDVEVRALGDESIEVVAGGGFCWSAEGGEFACVMARRGLQQVVQVSLADGACRVLTQGDRHVELLARSARHLVFTATSPARAQEVSSVDERGAQERELSQFNAWWRKRRAPLVQRRQFVVPDGNGGEEQIDGWLMLPAGHRGGPLRLLVDVHGGPASYVLLNYNAHPHWPVLCEQGWAVLALNCVGSSSYGREFSARLRARWGEIDLAQQMAAVSTLQKEGLADERLAILGKSYGGYLSSWAIGRTRMFRSAVVMAPVGNLETHYGTSDSGFYADPYSMCGVPFIDRETSRRLSPMQYVQQTVTPTIFLQGKDDERCPKCQSEELFVTIARAGTTPVEMALYPGGSHHFWEDERPSHRIDALKRALAWLTRWIDQPLPHRESGPTQKTASGTQVAEPRVRADRPGSQQSLKEIVMAQDQNRNQNQNQQGGQQEQQGGSQNQQGNNPQRSNDQQQQGGSQKNQQGGQQRNEAGREQDRNDANRNQNNQNQDDQNRQERR